jgi:uncharacterized SAM-binding protein YcdF (DUF218 family)
VIDRVARLLTAPLELEPAGDQTADAIVILGAPLVDGVLSDVALERVEAGVELYHRRLAPLVIASGRGEAAPMAARARALGVAEGDLVIEDRSRTTRENAEMTAALLAPGSRVWVVSQPFHLRRAVRCFRAAGLAPLPYARLDSIQRRRPDLALRWAAREYAAWLKVLLER